MALKLWLSAGAFVALTKHLVLFLKKLSGCVDVNGYSKNGYSKLLGPAKEFVITKLPYTCIEYSFFLFSSRGE
jgi:hypothetical protein